MTKYSNADAVRMGAIQHSRAVVREYDKLESKRQEALRVKREKTQRKK